jgi:hypothetical protein
MDRNAGASPGMLDKERTTAPLGYNRWLVPPAALAIHLSIGMAYGFSVFWLPLARAVGIREPVTCEDAGFLDLVTSTRCDWPVSMLGWTYTLFFVFSAPPPRCSVTGWSAKVRAGRASSRRSAGVAGSSSRRSVSMRTRSG